MFHNHPPESIYTIVLLRHGQSTGNAAGYYQGQSDFPLDEIGIQQANALAERWSNESLRNEGFRFDHVISSPLKRAHQTAKIIAAAISIEEIQLDALWMERNNGVLAGLRPDEAETLHPRPDFFHPFMPVGKTGESQWDLYLRAGQALKSLMDRPPGKYLVVSHGGLLNMVLYTMLGITPQANFHGVRFRFQNSAFAHLIYHPQSHFWRLEKVNDHAHWDF